MSRIPTWSVSMPLIASVSTCLPSACMHACILLRLRLRTGTKHDRVPLPLTSCPPPGRPAVHRVPKDGCVHLPDTPGFGLTLIRDNLVRPHPRDPEWSDSRHCWRCNPLSSPTAEAFCIGKRSRRPQSEPWTVPRALGRSKLNAACNFHIGWADKPRMKL